MGRYVRPLLRGLALREDITLTLLVRHPREVAAYRSIAGERIALAPLSVARTTRDFDRVWYPWNGIRFEARAPALVTINDDFAFAYPARGSIARRREQSPILRAVRDAAFIMTISRWSRDTLIERFALQDDRIGVLPLAPDPYFSPGREQSPFGDAFVLVVGAGERRKNVPFFIDVFERAFPAGDVRLVIVGDPEAMVAARLRVATVPVTLLRHVDDEWLRRLYRAAAVVAVPSLAEGFGLVAAEAQACGAVVLTANTSALPEVVGSAGVSLDPRDAAAWCDALRALVHDTTLNARYRELVATRSPATSPDATLDALLVALERMVDDGA